ncbi:uncharacterized protein BDR25DRAFT_337742 [Lindgomyces ingoldianus]|uniref:Uncharacterized protein n=1 Tax=Lindgomyces ingoldianus TaxID=673940 RepID=A0ACB6QAR3_9PLEO|nr:uncharacterized protein BDR25DRAFT_337742 [Lindgomyces ingoldianus]KAF2463585.1 hypothetical protein BDR25DRAFT_337742 [Lindgomyces ingoldianus]
MFRYLFRQPVKFSQLLQREDNESLLSSSSTSTITLRDVSNDNNHRVIFIALVASIICSSITLGLALWIGLRWQGGQFVFDADKFCIYHLSRYSPLVKEVQPNWHVVHFNGSFLKENVYRQSAGPEVDAAWSALGVDYRSLIVPASEAERTGLRHDQVQVSDYYGGGFPANVEGLHHLHCLNLLRKALHWNYDYYRDQKEGAFSNSEYVVRYHVTHCLDILRQQLMCVVDVGVLGQVWYQPEGEGKPSPFTDFNTNHQCRDYEAVRMWAEAHQLPPESEVDMSRFYKKPEPGDTIIPEVP